MRRAALLIPTLLAALHAAVVCADFGFAEFGGGTGGGAVDTSALSLVGTANLTASALRLTPPTSSAAGAVWCATVGAFSWPCPATALTRGGRHTQPQLVHHGFTCEFTFRAVLDDPGQVSSPCRVVDHMPGACVRRLGDGLALVLQRSAGSSALGLPGSGLGYAGLPGGAVAVEVDLWADSDARDPGDSHVAVLTRAQATLRSDHASAVGSMATSLEVGDGGLHTVRVTYDPHLAPGAPGDPAFKAAPHLASLIYPAGVAYRHGMGSLTVWVDPDTGGAQGGTAGWPPTLVVPLPLDVLLATGAECSLAGAGGNATGQVCGAPPPLPPPPPPSPPPPQLAGGSAAQTAPSCCLPGHAWVGITASTGQAVAAFELLSWGFTSQRAMN